MKNFLFIFFIGILSVPFLQMVFLGITEPVLVGVETASERPRLTLASWFDGSFQKLGTEWFADHIGFRGYLVKSENQLNWSVFHEVSATLL